jgi:hypothetical protein
MTAQEPFHNFFSQTGGSPLRRVVLVALVDDLDLLADGRQGSAPSAARADDAVKTRRVTPEEMTSDPDLRTLRNLNTREDYERALAEAGID